MHDLRLRRTVYFVVLLTVSTWGISRLLLGTNAVADTVTATETRIDVAIDGFTLKDFQGNPHSLADYEDQQAVVVFFMGTECPLAKLYGPRMQKLSQEYSQRDVRILGVSSNVQDSVPELAAFARNHGIRFPLLKDFDQRVADLFGATRTPEVFVLDRERKIRYHGRIDGQFTFGSGVGLAQPAPKRSDLAIALDELLTGKAISIPVTEAKGCLIGRRKEANDDSPVTYSNQIVRLFQDRCIECHRQGQIAPFALTDYDEAAGWGDMIAEVVRENRMPPWHADPNFGHFSNENRLSDAEQQLIETWVRNGCPKGDPKDLPAPREYQAGWFMPQEPDLVIPMADEPVGIKAQGVEDYRHYVVDPGFQEDKWVTMAECLPGNKAVVHHIIVYIKSPDARDSNIGDHELLVGFAPGTRPFAMPKGWARRIPAGSKLIFEMHYTPIGTPQQDLSSLGLVFMEEQDVTHQAWTTNAINYKINIPPHAANKREEARKRFDQQVQLLSLFPHMHMRGKSFRYELTYPDGRREVLLDVPQYDFNWQTSFVLSEPKLIPEGTEMLCVAHYDNSEDNLANPDPEKTVRWGEQTWDEMLIGWHDIAAPRVKQ